MKEKILGTVLASIFVLGIVAFLIGLIWVRAEASCGWWSWAPIKDIPLRCLKD